MLYDYIKQTETEAEAALDKLLEILADFADDEPEEKENM